MKTEMIHPEDGAAGSPGVAVNFYQIVGVVKTSNIFTFLLKRFIYSQVTYLYFRSALNIFLSAFLSAL